MAATAHPCCGPTDWCVLTTTLPRPVTHRQAPTLLSIDGANRNMAMRCQLKQCAAPNEQSARGSSDRATAMCPFRLPPTRLHAPAPAVQPGPPLRVLDGLHTGCVHCGNKQAQLFDHVAQQPRAELEYSVRKEDGVPKRGPPRGALPQASGGLGDSGGDARRIWKGGRNAHVV